MEVNLFNWGFIRKCIQAHEAITGKKPSVIQVPAPSNFQVLGVNVLLVNDSDQTHMTADAEKVLYHNQVEHSTKRQKLTPVK